MFFRVVGVGSVQFRDGGGVSFRGGSFRSVSLGGSLRSVHGCWCCSVSWVVVLPRRVGAGVIPFRGGSFRAPAWGVVVPFRGWFVS